MNEHIGLDIEVDSNIIDQILSAFPDVMIIAIFWRIHQILEDKSNLPMIDLYIDLLKQDVKVISGSELRSKIERSSMSGNTITERSLEIFIKNGLLDCGEHIFLNETEVISINQISIKDIDKILNNRNQFSLQRGFKILKNSEETSVQLSIESLQFLIQKIFHTSEAIPVVTLKKKLDGLRSFLCEFDMQTTHNVIRKGGNLYPDNYRVKHDLYYLDDEVIAILNKIENFNSIVDYLIWFNQTKNLSLFYKKELRKRLNQVSPELSNKCFVDLFFNYINSTLILPKYPTFKNLLKEKTDKLAFEILPSGRPMKDFIIGLKNSNLEVPSIIRRFLVNIPINTNSDVFSKEIENWLSCICQLYGALYANSLIFDAVEKFLVEKKNKILNYSYIQEKIATDNSRRELESNRAILEHIRVNLIVPALETYTIKKINEIQAEFIRESLKS